MALTTIVFEAVFLAGLGTDLLLVAGFVEVRLGHEDQGLDGHEHLQHSGRRFVPALTLLPFPRAQQRQTHLAAANKKHPQF